MSDTLIKMGVHPSWHKSLIKILKNHSEVGSKLKSLPVHYPDRLKMFKAFSINRDNVKVIVIAGKPNKNSTGYALTNPNSTSFEDLPKDSKVFINSMIDTFELDAYENFYSADMRMMIDDDVLLLNCPLTTSDDIDHKELWSDLIYDLLSDFLKSNVGIFIWNLDTSNQKFVEKLQKENPNNHYYYSDINNFTPYFHEINEKFIRMYGMVVPWCIPF